MDAQAKQVKSNQQFDEVVSACVDIFKKKQVNERTSWAILREFSYTEQLRIKAWRIRNIQELKGQDSKDLIPEEFREIVNYASIALMIIRNQAKDGLTAERAVELHEANIAEARALFQNKNHDYGEAWRMMRIRSMTDLILMKLLRVEQIRGNEGKTLASEGLDANYLDILNYAVFCLIHISENRSPMD